jgi:hypothetical protein
MAADLIIILSLALAWLTLYAGYNLSIKHFDDRP